MGDLMEIGIRGSHTKIILRTKCTVGQAHRKLNQRKVFGKPLAGC